jgi:hypothetical protein
MLMECSVMPERHFHVFPRLGPPSTHPGRPDMQDLNGLTHGAHHWAALEE